MHSMVVAARGFAVEFSVAMHIRLKVAVHALHPVGDMDVVQVNSLGEFVRIVGLDDVVVRIQANGPGGPFLKTARKIQP